MTATREDARAVAGSIAAVLRRQQELGSASVSADAAARLAAAVEHMVAEGETADPTVHAPSPATVPEHPKRDTVPRAEPATPAVPSRPASPVVGSVAARPARPSRPTPSDERPPWAPRGGSVPARGVGSLALAEIRADLGDCTRCHLHERRTNLVFGVGNPDARLMFIGEAPGADEDRQGEPFVGAAGQLLTRMIEAMGLSRSDVYIANVLKCRPPGNRDPQPDEVAKCRPFLDRQIAAVAPDVIVTLGRIAPTALLGRDVRVTQERGRWTEYQGVALMLTLHPAYLLRNPAAKRDVWSDLQQVMARLGLETPRRGPQGSGRSPTTTDEEER